jgi:hypothetical protein
MGEVGWNLIQICLNAVRVTEYAYVITHPILDVRGLLFGDSLKCFSWA